MNDHPDLAPLIEDYLSIKILRQFPFETMITFMCAQGIGMPIIRRQVALISEKFGDRSTVLINGKLRSFFSFPSPSRLAEADPELLASCTNNNRTRAANIIAVSKAVMEKRLDLDMLGAGTGSSEAIRHELCLNRGIGLKIADCIALFGFGRFSAFPIDTHVRQYLGKWFMIREADRSLTERNYLFIQEQACRILIPEYAGYAGHILFHCWRKEIRQLKTF
jgi:N-glycosylase/DNA lyase